MNPVAPQPKSGFQAYKPGEGYATRLGIMVVVMAYVGFACHHWYYYWSSIRDFIDNLLPKSFGILTSWMFDASVEKYISVIGTLLLAGLGFFAGYYFIYVKENSADFLIKTDGELAKVTWPKITPWFKADTQVWGATYVVIIVVAALTLYVFGVDYILQFFYKGMFLNKWTLFR